ncbi:hypothetical protein C8E97_0687 [Saccharothrix australiensis]|uniref:Uncharacterized protein n=1 Tax=Saccharothrix australiensis TaxID=2072 RepID=A0A495VUN6_9PSEU|nr:hypothetical protein C8E97_0687 [Saccharothrix australiensis]
MSVVRAFGGRCLPVVRSQAEGACLWCGSRRRCLPVVRSPAEGACSWRVPSVEAASAAGPQCSVPAVVRRSVVRLIVVRMISSSARVVVPISRLGASSCPCSGA